MSASLAVSPSQKYQRLTYLFASLIILGSLAGIVVPAGLHWDFGNFYDAGRRILAGQADSLYTPHSLIAGQSPQATTGFWGTPLSAYLYVPMALLAPRWGLMFFKVETAVFNIAALLLLYFHNRRFVNQDAVSQGRFAATFAFLSLIYQPIWTAFRTGGQTTPIVFFLLAVALLATSSVRTFLTALAFGFAVMIKPALITAIVVFVALSGFRLFRYLFFVFLCTGLLSLAVLGWPVHAAFLQLMLKGSGNAVPWFYNSGLYVTFENMKLLAPPDSWPRLHEAFLNVLKAALKLGVLASMVVIVYRSRKRPWTHAARSHFNFLMAICFFCLQGHIVYEAYLTFLFIVLAYLVANDHCFTTKARRLIGAIFFLSFWQNIIWVDLLRHFVRLDSVAELLTIGLFKSGPLILMLTLLVRHHQTLFASYETEAWGPS
jgi:hypothetical protein